MIMQHRSSETESHTIDETKGTKKFCPANIYYESDRHADGGQINGYEYQACGVVLRKHKDGELYCPDHGLMHV